MIDVLVYSNQRSYLAFSFCIKWKHE